MRVSYIIPDEPEEFVSGYGQTYPALLKVNPNLVSRIWDKRIRLGSKISDKVVDILEKYGMARLDMELMEQDSRNESLNQELIKFHLYHWLYDCVASLDSVACLINLKLGISDNLRGIAMNNPFIEKVKNKDVTLGRLLSEEFHWIKELKDMRDCIIHREGRLVVGGGTEPSVVIDFSRALVRGLPLHRMDIHKTTDEYSQKLDTFIGSVLSTVNSW